jgi:hypothetical protein
MKRFLLSVIVLIMAAQLSQGQVLIALIFGNKLNSDKLKFGLDGGANFSTLSNIGCKYTTGFNLGFYFDILLKKDKNWFIHTGVIVKSPMGAKSLQPYPISDSTLYTQLDSGKVDRKLRYFNVPILVRYKFKPGVFVELGPMLGLLYKANDEFLTTVNEKNDLSFTNKVLTQYYKLDVGGMAGIGYHLMKGNGINLGLRYYYGFTNILKDNPGKSMRNSGFYAFMSLPIGAGEKAKAKNEAAAKKKAEKKARKEQEKQFKEKK